MAQTALERTLQEMVAPSLQAMGYVIVQLRLAEGVRSRTLQMMVERADQVIMGFDDCERISHTVSALLDVEDPIQGAYQLEVSSPGIDRPLFTFEDFQRFAGHEAKVETQLAVQGRKRFRGVIVRADAQEAVLNVDGVEHALRMDNIRAAKLVLTDALIAAAYGAMPKAEPQTEDEPPSGNNNKRKRLTKKG